jgi:hypothetical protein
MRGIAKHQHVAFPFTMPQSFALPHVGQISVSTTSPSNPAVNNHWCYPCTRLSFSTYIAPSLPGRDLFALGEDDLNCLPRRQDVDIRTPSHAQRRWS